MCVLPDGYETGLCEEVIRWWSKATSTDRKCSFPLHTESNYLAVRVHDGISPICLLSSHKTRDPSGRLAVIYALDSSCSANSSHVADAVTVKLPGNYGNHLKLCRATNILLFARVMCD